MAAFSLNGLSSAAYSALVYNILLFTEESGDAKEQAYVDGKGIPTIGIGFNLKVSDNVAAILSVLYTSSWGPLVQTQKDSLSRAIAVIAGSQTWTNATLPVFETQVINTLNNSTYNFGVAAGSFKFDQTNTVNDAFDIISADYEAALNAWLTSIGGQASALVTTKSKERAALLSLQFNGLLGEKLDVNGNPIPNQWKNPSLRSAINQGDRVDVWYQIRYQSNGGIDKPGVAKRHFFESHTFGLYDPNVTSTNISEADAIQVYEMYSLNRDTILDYEKNYSPRIALANSDYSLGSDPVLSLEASLATAARNLLQTYAPNSSIDVLDIYVGGSNADTLSARKRNGYVIDSGDEQPVLVLGGGGNDTITGSIKNDALHGEAGDDTLSGGQGNDYLNGGSDSDTFRFSAGDGVDTILDNSGSDDEIEIGGTTLNSNSITAEGSSNAARTFSDTNNNRYLWDETSQSLTIITNSDSVNGGVIRVNQFDNNDFGLDLSNVALPARSPLTPVVNNVSSAVDWGQTPDYTSTRYSTRHARQLFITSRVQPYQQEWDVQQSFNYQAENTQWYSPSDLPDASYDNYAYSLWYGAEIFSNWQFVYFDGDDLSDHLEGGHRADLLSGYGGDDYIALAGGDDRGVGGEGSDIIDGGAGNDVIFGYYNPFRWKDIPGGTVVFGEQGSTNTLRNKCSRIFHLIYVCLLSMTSYGHADDDWQQSYHYFLVMSKDDSVCQHMLSVYNQDLKTKGKLVLGDHPEYRVIEWDFEHQVMATKSETHINKLSYVAESKMSVYDINNDGKNEIVFFIEYLPKYPGQVESAFSYHPAEIYHRVKTGIDSSELYKTRLDPHLSREIHLFSLQKLPVQSVTVLNEGTDSELKTESHISVGGFPHIYPFIFENTNYVSLFSESVNGLGGGLEHTNTILIRQYQPDDTAYDICYYIKTSVFKYQKNSHRKQGEAK